MSMISDSTKDAEGAGPPDNERKESHETLIEPSDALPPIRFDDLPEVLRDAAGRCGWKELMPVQAHAIPYLLSRRDLMVQSRTGSGKTGAFVLPMLERLDFNRAECQALVLVPTRELARQVSSEALKLAGDSGLRVASVYGGVGYGEQLEALRGGAQLVVGTPGRVLDLLLRRSFNLARLRILVFDEADRMLSMGFYPDMVKVRSYLPKQPLNAYLFSATFPLHVLRLAGQFLHNPELLSLSGDHVHVSEVDHVYYLVPGMEKDRALVRLIEMENPTAAIIFCNTKAKVHYVAVILQRFGYDADEISADLSQQAREKVLERVRKGRLRFLVATDVAARGIDIPELTHVFQYEPPEDAEAYIHRAGRTGRAGASGRAISLIAGMELVEIQRIAKRFKINMQRETLPSDEQVEAVVAERVTVLLEARFREYDTLRRERMARFVPLVDRLVQSNEEKDLLAMLVDDYYQQMLHTPLAVPDDSPAADAGGRENRPPASRKGKPRNRRNRG